VATPVNYNPGEFVFDQVTGAPYIDGDGNPVLVAPGLTVTTADGTVLSGDPEANAAWYRGNKWRGETLRDRTIGVPFSRNVLGQASGTLAVTAIVAEIRARTPGIAGIISLRVLNFDPATRVMRFTARLLKKDGRETPLTATIGG